jgi:hypothetical protein
VQRLYREQNLGCGRAVSEAIAWFFDQGKEGIILEDDCLPNDSFFPFCETLLECYREDDRIGTISGDFFYPESLQHHSPYIFSKYAQIWGWATWRRVWQCYDFGLAGTDDEWMKIIARHNPIDLEARYWFAVYRYLKRGIIDTWDYQVMLSCWKHDLVHIASTRNLVENLGYGADATRTNFASPNAKLRAQNFSSDLPVMPIQIDPLVDQGTFFYRFLESLHNTWILHEAVDVTEKLSWARWEVRELAKKAEAQPNVIGEK